MAIAIMRVVNILYEGIFGILNYFTYLCTAFSESVFFHLLASRDGLNAEPTEPFIQATVEKKM